MELIKILRIMQQSEFCMYAWNILKIYLIIKSEKNLFNSNNSSRLMSKFNVANEDKDVLWRPL